MGSFLRKVMVRSIWIAAVTLGPCGKHELAISDVKLDATGPVKFLRPSSARRAVRCWTETT